MNKNRRRYLKACLADFNVCYIDGIKNEYLCFNNNSDK